MTKREREDLISINELGFNFKDKRMELGLSQAVMARECGVSTVTYQQWEQGVTKYLRKDNFDKLKEKLGKYSFDEK